MERICKKLCRAGLLHHAARIHHDDFIAGFRDDAEVVSDEHDGHADFRLKPRHEIEDLCLDGDVEGGGRLVGDE